MTRRAPLSVSVESPRENFAEILYHGRYKGGLRAEMGEYAAMREFRFLRDVGSGGGEDAIAGKYANRRFDDAPPRLQLLIVAISYCHY
jgi:hypothetical protein